MILPECDGDGCGNPEREATCRSCGYEGVSADRITCAKCGKRIKLDYCNSCPRAEIDFLMNFTDVGRTVARGMELAQAVEAGVTLTISDISVVDLECLNEIRAARSEMQERANRHGDE